MAKRAVAVILECSRCPRKESLPPEESDPVPFYAKLGDLEVKYEDLCKACQSTLKAALQTLAKVPTKASRGAKEEDDNE
jgi:hypothetical protein